MTGSKISLTAIVACTPSGVIGLGGSMPWTLSSDLRRFKSLTMGGTLIMGRKTYDSIGKPLPGRETIVLSRRGQDATQTTDEVAGVVDSEVDSVPGLHRVNNVEQAIAVAGALARPAYVVGGAEIYRLFFAYCDQIWLTRVWSSVEGDTRIDLPLQEFSLLEQSRHPQGERDSAPTEFQKWQRKNSVPKS
jgi:dihydrofolate reductase